jgi:nucleoid-associated protein YgaU
MADVGGMLEKQVGPFPMGVWVALVGGGLGIAWYVNKGKTPAAATADPTTSATGDGTYDTVGADPVATTTVTDTSPQTNDEWGKRAIDFLIASNYDPSAANQAVNLYLINGTLTVQQTALINAALRKLGSPPQPVGSTATNPPQQPPPTGGSAKLGPPKRIAATGRSSTSVTLAWDAVTGAYGYRLYRSDKATNIGETTTTHMTVSGLTAGHTYSFHVRTLNADKVYGDRSGDYHVTTLKTSQKTKTVTHKVKSGETLRSIASYFYGDSDFWRRIYDANKSKIPNIDKLTAGITLSIPSATKHI